MSNELNDILNFNDNAKKQKKPKYTLDEKLAVESLVDALIDEDNETKDLKTVRFQLHVQLDEDIKLVARRTGKTQRWILSQQLKRLFDGDVELISDYLDGEYVHRQVRIDADLFEQLDKYARKNAVTKKFIVEALFSEYVKRFK